MAGGGGGGIGGALGGVIGGITGEAKASGDRAKQQGYAEQAYNTLISIGMPPDLSKEIVYQKFQEAGILSPEVEKAIELTHSKVAEMEEAPETREAQMEALRTLQQLGKTGLGAEDRAALSEVRDQVQRDLEAKRQQILQQAQARGMGGSGAELIAQLQGSQAGANLASREGLNIGAQAQRRALESIIQGSGLAGQVRGQDYQAALNKARAEDELNRFNVQQEAARQTRNIAARNIAQQQNLAQRQAVMDANVQMANREKLRQVQAQRDYWDDQLRRAQVQSGGYAGMASEYGRRANQIAGRDQALGTGIGNIVGSGAQLAFGGGSTPKLGSGGQLTDYNTQPRYQDQGWYEALAASKGGMVPGDAKYPGDHMDNDVVDIKASPGEIVLPKSVTEHEKAPEIAKKFVDLVLSMKNKKGS